MRAIYTPKEFDLLPQPETIDFGAAQPKRSIQNFLAELTADATESDYLYYSPIAKFSHQRVRYRLPRYLFLGDTTDAEPIRIGIFAGIHGDEPEGASALVEFLLRLHREPQRAFGYQIFGYPICNPSGFEDGSHASRAGSDLNHEWWRGSREPEIYYLERELGVIAFHGVVTLHSSDAGHGVYIFSRGATLAESLVEPMLAAAEQFLPRAKNLAARQCAHGHRLDQHCHERVLSNSAELSPAPFEIIIETPQSAPLELQVHAVIAALDRMLAEYRPFLALQQNI